MLRNELTVLLLVYEDVTPHPNDGGVEATAGTRHQPSESLDGVPLPTMLSESAPPLSD